MIMNRGATEIAAAWVIAFVLIASLAAHVFTPERRDAAGYARVIAPSFLIGNSADFGMPLNEAPFAPLDDASAPSDLANANPDPTAP